MSDSWDPMDCSQAPLSMDAGKKIGVGCHFFLQGIFLTQESNLCLLYCRWILYHQHHLGSPHHHKMGKSGHKHCHTRWTLCEDEGQNQGPASASPERYETGSPLKQPNLLTLDLGLLASAAAAAKSLQSCPALCDPIDSSPPGSPVPGILQARTLEWVAISFSNAWKWKVKVK